jgi:hypothetical protein
MLQAKITLEAQQLKRADVTSCCQEAGVTYVHTRTVSSETMIDRYLEQADAEFEALRQATRGADPQFHAKLIQARRRSHMPQT